MLSYECNRDCNFCFALHQKSIFKKPLQLEDFMRLLDWLESSESFVNKPKKICLLGGEPTIYPKFKEILNLLHKRNIMGIIFSNCLFDNNALEGFRNEAARAVIINYNPQDQYTKDQWKLLDQNIQSLIALNEKKEIKMDIKFSYNITEESKDCTFLLDACKKYDINKIRCAVVSPDFAYSNNYMDMKSLLSIKKHVLDFIKRASDQDLHIDWDCCVPYCMFSEKEWLFIKKKVRKIQTTCTPALDINPDLTMYYCLPLARIQSQIMDKYENLQEISEFFLKQTEELRWDVNTFEKCKKCKYKIRRSCQGGCLALKAEMDNNQLREKRVFIRTWGGIGDCLMMTPAIRALKKENPKRKIMVVCNQNHKNLLETNPYIDQLSVSPDESAFKGIKLWERKYFPSYKRFNPGISDMGHAADIIGEMLDVKLKDMKPDIFLSEDDEQFALDTLKKSNGKKTILLHPSTKISNKEWNKKNGEMIVKKFKEFQFIQLGLEEDEMIKGCLDLRGRTTVRQAIALLKHADLLVSVDSFLNHATMAVGTKGVILFGASTPKVWGYDNNINIYKNVDCAPCTDTKSDECDHRKCMTQISVEEVADAINAALNGYIDIKRALDPVS